MLAPRNKQQWQPPPPDIPALPRNVPSAVLLLPPAVPPPPAAPLLLPPGVHLRPPAVPLLPDIVIPTHNVHVPPLIMHRYHNSTIQLTSTPTSTTSHDGRPLLSPLLQLALLILAGGFIVCNGAEYIWTKRGHFFPPATPPRQPEDHQHMENTCWGTSKKKGCVGKDKDDPPPDPPGDPEDPPPGPATFDAAADNPDRQASWFAMLIVGLIYLGVAFVVVNRWYPAYTEQVWEVLSLAEEWLTLHLNTTLTEANLREAAQKAFTALIDVEGPAARAFRDISVEKVVEEVVGVVMPLKTLCPVSHNEVVNTVIHSVQVPLPTAISATVPMRLAVTTLTSPVVATPVAVALPADIGIPIVPVDAVNPVTAVQDVLVHVVPQFPPMPSPISDSQPEIVEGISRWRESAGMFMGWLLLAGTIHHVLGWVGLLAVEEPVRGKIQVGGFEMGKDDEDDEKIMEVDVINVEEVTGEETTTTGMGQGTTVVAREMEEWEGRDEEEEEKVDGGNVRAFFGTVEEAPLVSDLPIDIVPGKYGKEPETVYFDASQASIGYVEDRAKASQATSRPLGSWDASMRRGLGDAPQSSPVRRTFFEEDGSVALELGPDESHEASAKDPFLLDRVDTTGLSSMSLSTALAASIWLPRSLPLTDSAGRVFSPEASFSECDSLAKHIPPQVDITEDESVVLPFTMPSITMPSFSDVSPSSTNPRLPSSPIAGVADNSCTLSAVGRALEAIELIVGQTEATTARLMLDGDRPDQSYTLSALGRAFDNMDMGLDNMEATLLRVTKAMDEDEADRADRSARANAMDLSLRRKFEALEHLLDHPSLSIIGSVNDSSTSPRPESSLDAILLPSTRQTGEISMSEQLLIPVFMEEISARFRRLKEEVLELDGNWPAGPGMGSEEVEPYSWGQVDTTWQPPAMEEEDEVAGEVEKSEEEDEQVERSEGCGEEELQEQQELESTEALWEEGYPGPLEDAVDQQSDVLPSTYCPELSDILEEEEVEAKTEAGVIVEEGMVEMHEGNEEEVNVEEEEEEEEEEKAEVGDREEEAQHEKEEEETQQEEGDDENEGENGENGGGQNGENEGEDDEQEEDEKEEDEKEDEKEAEKHHDEDEGESDEEKRDEGDEGKQKAHEEEEEEEEEEAETEQMEQAPAAEEIEDVAEDHLPQEEELPIPEPDPHHHPTTGIESLLEHLADYTLKSSYGSQREEGDGVHHEVSLEVEDVLFEAGMEVDTTGLGGLELPAEEDVAAEETDVVKLAVEQDQVEQNIQGMVPAEEVAARELTVEHAMHIGPDQPIIASTRPTTPNHAEFEFEEDDDPDNPDSATARRRRGVLAIPGFIPTSPMLAGARGQLKEAAAPVAPPPPRFTLPSTQLRRVDFSEPKPASPSINSVDFRSVLKSRRGDGGQTNTSTPKFGGKENAMSTPIPVVPLRRASVTPSSSRLAEDSPLSSTFMARRALSAVSDTNINTPISTPTPAFLPYHLRRQSAPTATPKNLAEQPYKPKFNDFWSPKPRPSSS